MINLTLWLIFFTRQLGHYRETCAYGSLKAKNSEKIDHKKRLPGTTPNVYASYAVYAVPSFHIHEHALHAMYTAAGLPWWCRMLSVAVLQDELHARRRQSQGPRMFSLAQRSVPTDRRWTNARYKPASEDINTTDLASWHSSLNFSPSKNFLFVRTYKIWS